MDCVIPGNAVRPFCAAIACLSRVGKDILFDFDPLDGLTLCGLSDSKAVFASFHYEPAFFRRCSTPPPLPRHKRPRLTQDTESASTLSQQHNPSRWCARVSIKALVAIVRPRKEVASLHIHTTPNQQLAFDFTLQRADGQLTRVIHKVGIALAQSVSAMTSMDQASELIVQPNVVSTMLEPLRRSPEVALLIDESRRLISSLTFAHEDFSHERAGTIAIGQNTTSIDALKTETTISYDDLMDLHYVSDPRLLVQDEDTSGNNNAIPPPPDLKEHVMLVFTYKEFKAMLQFCMHSQLEELPVTLQFLYGGKPMVATAKSPTFKFSLQFVMATLDYRLLDASSVTATTTKASARVRGT
eukprot:Nitzschia sp. Nitz4//scaffold253_size28098//7836//8903//NITZ4_008140-RA/size28098-processed-gene-0.29-mRNA-1//-1//CDS//3329544297//1161//frame0